MPGMGAGTGEASRFQRTPFRGAEPGRGDWIRAQGNDPSAGDPEVGVSDGIADDGGRVGVAGAQGVAGVPPSVSAASPLFRLSERVKEAARASGERNRRNAAASPRTTEGSSVSERVETSKQERRRYLLIDRYFLSFSR